MVSLEDTHTHTIAVKDSTDSGSVEFKKEGDRHENGSKRIHTHTKNRKKENMKDKITEKECIMKIEVKRTGFECSCKFENYSNL